MGMEINPTYVEIGRLFEQNYIFEIPKYQRYYAWEDEQVDDFIFDIKSLIGNPEKDHFFGGIVCVEKQVPGSTRAQREIVDGQQRIITTMLLVMSIYGEYKKIQAELQETDENYVLVSARINKIENQYINFQDEINRKPKTIKHLSVSEADEKCYEAIMSGQEIPEERDSHKKMKNAFMKISRFVQGMIGLKDTIDDKLTLLGDILNVIHSSCTVIFIDTKTKKDAYSLFQVLNDRGMGLSVGDLLKSKTLEIVSSEKKPEYEEKLVKKWDEILAKDSKTLDRFLKYYYMSVEGNRASATAVFDEYMKNIFKMPEDKEEYDDNEKKQIEQMIDILHKASKVFYLIEEGNWPYPEEQPVTEWDRNRLSNLVKYLDYEIILALLLAAKELNQKKFNEIVQMLEKFMFRYKGICNNKHQILGDLFMKEAVLIRNDPQKYSVNHLREQLKDLIDKNAGDTVFKERLKELKYVKKGNNKLIKYFFSTLTEYYAWYAKGAKGKPVAEKGYIINYENVSIEHIFSQNPDDNSVPCFDVNELRNLTILTLEENNEKVKNKPYSDKRSTYILSNYKINKWFEGYDSWDEMTMDSWQEYLLDMSCKVFSI